MADIVEGPTIAALSCGKPVYLIVLLHGPGADGQSIIDHAYNWSPTLPKADFLAIEAPFENPGGGRDWFDGDGGDPAAGLKTIAPLLDAFLDDALARRRLPDSHLALVGFSHGAMLALNAGLRRPNPPAAIVAFAGALDGALFPAEIRSKPPILLIHGDADPVVPIAAMERTEERLKNLGVPVTALRRPGLGHAIDDDGILAAGDFLTTHVSHAPVAQSGT